VSCSLESMDMPGCGEGFHFYSSRVKEMRCLGHWDLCSMIIVGFDDTSGRDGNTSFAASRYAKPG
jgi:hypothetical protein